MTDKAEKKTEKTYSITADEKANIDSRQALIKQYQYIIHVINADIESYLNFVVAKRLGIKEGEKFSLSPDNKTITI